MPRTGRPTKLTPAIRNAIVKSVTAGNYLETAADLVGVDVATVRRWIQRGAQARQREEGPLPDDVPFADFCAAVKKGRALAVSRAQAVIQKRGKNWQAAAWWLERSAPYWRKESLGFEGQIPKAQEERRTIEWVLGKPPEPPPEPAADPKGDDAPDASNAAPPG